MMKFFSEQKFRKLAPIIGVFLIGLTTFLGYKISDLKFDYDFEKFFPADDSDADYFYAHIDKFEYDNNFILVAIENKKGIFDISFMNEVKSLTTKLKNSLPFITGVRSITNQNEVSFFGINNSVERPYVDLQKWIEDSSFITKDSTRIYSSKELINT